MSQPNPDFLCLTNKVSIRLSAMKNLYHVVRNQKVLCIYIYSPNVLISGFELPYLKHLVNALRMVNTKLEKMLVLFLYSNCTIPITIWISTLNMIHESWGVKSKI